MSSSANSATATGAARRMSTRDATIVLASAITSTDAIASDADDHVDPHSSANCTIDFVSSSMKPAPRKKKCHDQAPPPPPRANHTAITETTSTSASAAR